MQKITNYHTVFEGKKSETAIYQQGEKEFVAINSGKTMLLRQRWQTIYAVKNGKIDSFNKSKIKGNIKQALINVAMWAGL